jgi:hypothetical protein
MNKDMDIIQKNFISPNKPHMVNYEEVIKALVPVVSDIGVM